MTLTNLLNDQMVGIVVADKPSFETAELLRDVNLSGISVWTTTTTGMPFEADLYLRPACGAIDVRIGLDHADGLDLVQVTVSRDDSRSDVDNPLVGCKRPGGLAVGGEVDPVATGRVVCGPICVEREVAALMHSIDLVEQQRSWFEPWGSCVPVATAGDASSSFTLRDLDSTVAVTTLAVLRLPRHEATV